jgi:hypothetical protein
MEGELTTAEVARALRRLEGEHRNFVTREVYERDMKELREDVKEIKTTLNKAMWGIIGLFLAIVVQVVVAVASRGFPT